MSDFLSDAFTAADWSALEAHTADTGGKWAKRSAGAGSLGIYQDQLYAVGGYVEYLYTNPAAPAGAEYDVDVDMNVVGLAPTPRSMKFSVVFRYDAGTGNYTPRVPG
jgi:hypothetical protein